jgi:hypothetical protein
MTVFYVAVVKTREALSVSAASRVSDRLEVTFDDETLVADAGLIVPATLVVRLGLEAVVNQTVGMVGRVGGALPGRKVLTLVAAILVGGSHIDHTDKLRAGATEKVLPFRVMAPSTLGTFLRAFTFGHIRQLDAVIAETIRPAWSMGTGPGTNPVTIDVDSTICEVHGKAKHGAAYGYTKTFGYHPILATRANTGEVLHARLRKGSSQRGAKRFVEELAVDWTRTCNGQCLKSQQLSQRQPVVAIRDGLFVARSNWATDEHPSRAVNSRTTPNHRHRHGAPNVAPPNERKAGAPPPREADANRVPHPPSCCSRYTRPVRCRGRCVRYRRVSPSS